MLQTSACRIFFFQAEDGIRDYKVTGVQTCALPIWTDVTGSIEGKVRRMFEIAEHVDVCMIVNGNVKNRVRDALRGKRVVGTRIVRGQIGRASCRERV